MSDHTAASRSHRIFGLLFSLLLLVSGGLILVVGFKRSDNPYLPIELIALMIGSIGITASFLLER